MRVSGWRADRFAASSTPEHTSTHGKTKTAATARHALLLALDSAGTRRARLNNKRGPRTTWKTLRPNRRTSATFPT